MDTRLVKILLRRELQAELEAIALFAPFLKEESRPLILAHDNQVRTHLRELTSQGTLVRPGKLVHRARAFLQELEVPTEEANVILRELFFSADSGLP